MSMNGKLNDDDLVKVTGGVLFDSSNLWTEDHKNMLTPWELLDDNANVLVINGTEMRFPTREAALQAASAYGIDATEENWDWVKGRRGIV